MKILLALPFPPPQYGPSIYSSNLFKCLVDLGFDPKKVNTEINNKTTDIGRISLFKYFKVLKIALKILKNSFNSYTFLNINLSSQGLIRTFINHLSAIFAKDICLIFHEGNIKKFYNEYNFICKLIFRYLVSKSKYLILLDNQQIESLKNFVNENKLYLIGAYREDTYKKIDKKNYIVFYSNLIKEKGAEDAIKSYLKLPKKQRLNWKMIVAGNKKDLIFYKYLYEAFSHEVSFFTDKTYEEYQNLLNESKIFIYPTIYKYEQQPAVIIEALMNKMIVISYKWAGIVNMLPANNSFLVDANIDELTNMLTKVTSLNNLDQDLERSRDIFLNNFGYKIFQDRLSTFLNNFS